MTKLSEQKQAIREAAGWYAVLCADEVSDQDRLEHEHWLAASAVNQHAWQQIGRLQQQMGGLPGQQAHQVLQAGREYQLNRRQVLSLLALVSGGGALAWSGWQYTPLPDLTATWRTGRGEQLTQRLPDGSELMLNTHSAVDIENDGQILRVRLRRGEIQITTAAELGNRSGRPAITSLVVETAQGHITPMGTRFIVRQFDHWTRVSVLKHSVSLKPLAAEQSLVLHKGQSAQMTAAGTDVLSQGSDVNLHWPEGMLVISDWRLDRLLQELGRYRTGIIRCAPEVAALKISGAYPITETDLALSAIARALPVSIKHITPFWVIVHGG